MNNTYKFPVSMKPIFVSNKEVPGKKAIVRDDTQDTLGIVSEKYQIITHTDVMDAFKKVLPSDTVEQAVVTNNGAVLFAKFTIPSIKVEVGPGDEVALQLHIKNSYNGNNSLHIMLGAIRFVCSNGMVIGKKFFVHSQRHQGNPIIKIDLLSIQIEALVNHFKKMAPKMKEMAQTESHSHADMIFDVKKTGLPNYLCAAAYAEYKKAEDYTQWGVYNALTYAITHGMKRPSPQLAIEYGVKAWDIAQMA